MVQRISKPISISGISLLLSALLLVLATSRPGLAEDMTGTVVETKNASRYTNVHLGTETRNV